jgi:hypothetical protein
MKKLLLLCAALLAAVFLWATYSSNVSAQRWGHYDYWDEAYVKSQVPELGIHAVAAATINKYGYLEFPSNIEKEAFYLMNMPHSYKFGTEMKIHVHWAKTTSAPGDVVWKVDHECADVGEIFTDTLPNTTELSYITDDQDTAYLHAYATGAFLPAPELTSLAGMCVMRLWRDVAADDYADNAIVYLFGVHFLADTIGSATETAKTNPVGGQ